MRAVLTILAVLAVLALAAAPLFAGPVPCEVRANVPADPPRQVPRVVTRPDGTRVQVWEVVPPDAPKASARAEEPAFKPLTYAEGLREFERGKVLVTFWGCPARPVPGCVVAGMPLTEHVKAPVISVHVRASAGNDHRAEWVKPDCDDYGLGLYRDRALDYRRYHGRVEFAAPPAYVPQWYNPNPLSLYSGWVRSGST